MTPTRATGTLEVCPKPMHDLEGRQTGVAFNTIHAVNSFPIPGLRRSCIDEECYGYVDQPYGQFCDECVREMAKGLAHQARFKAESLPSLDGLRAYLGEDNLTEQQAADVLTGALVFCQKKQARREFWDFVGLCATLLVIAIGAAL